MPQETNNLDQTLHKFMSVTAKSKVAVVVPLFGYWQDAKTEQLNAQTLKFTLDRLYSSVHNLILIFVAEPPRLNQEVVNILAGLAQAGNTKGVVMEKGSTYADYIRKGFEVALEEEGVQFISNVNPWVAIQHNGLDILIDRVNRDDAKIVSGFDLRGLIEPDEFKTKEFQIPKEERNMSIDFFAMKTFAAQMVRFDEAFKTHFFLARDVCQEMYQSGFEVITSQRVPIFTFQVEWAEFEPSEEFEQDKAYFISKWKYDPTIKYE